MEETYFFENSSNGISFPKDPSDKDKYVVMTCAKNENEYIIEWLEHYFSLGFDKVFIADNNDLGNDSLYNTIKDYVNDGRVQIFDFRGNPAVQVGLYVDFCRAGNFKWCAFYDCDEFLDIGVYPDIKSYMEQYVNCDVVLLNWLVFGPCGQLRKEEGRVQDRFPVPQGPLLYFKENSFVKSIVRGDHDKFYDCWFNGSHVPINDRGDIIYTVAGYYVPNIVGHAYFHPRYKNGYIKHYYTKSFEEWVTNKSQRGWPDGTESLAISKYFIFRDNDRPSLDFMSSAIFKIDKYDAAEEFKDALEAYDVINVRCNGEFTYPFFTEMMDVLKAVKDHTFVVSDSFIDDTLYNIMLEYAYLTGNRLVYARNDAEIWMAFEKFHKKNYTYYIITFN